MIAGCDVWEDIFDYCRVKENWFRESLHMKLKHGIPSQCIVTADAMSCQKEIVKTIEQKGGDYALALKENQPLLYQEVKEYMVIPLNQPVKK